MVIHKLQRGLSDLFIAQNWTDAIDNAVNYKRSSAGSSKDVVINISLNYNSPIGIGVISDALKRARDTNIVVCCAAGNGNTLVDYPARLADSLNNIISVGATDRNDTRSSYSNFAPSSTGFPKWLTLMAPGGIHEPGTPNITDDLITTSKTSFSSYGNAAGTSFATPLVTSTVALMFSVNSNLKASQIRDRIIRGCENQPSTYSQTYGYGRLNTFNSEVLAVDSVLGINSNDSNMTFTFFRNIRIASSFSIPRKCTIVVKPGYSIILDKGKNLTFQSRAKIKLEGLTNQPATFIQRKTSVVSDRGEFLMGSNTYYCVEDSATFNLTGPGPEGPNDYGCVAMWGGNLILEYNATFNINTGAFMTVKDGGAIYLGDNCHLKFGGISYLEFGEDSKMFFGSNSSISFSNNSYLYADTEDSSHIYFSGITDTTKWNGITFDNCFVSDTLEKCIFTNAKTAVTINNSPATSFVSRVFEDNTFNVPSGGDYKGIYGENNYNILIQDNVFNLPSANQNISSGIYLKNSTTSGSVDIGGGQERKMKLLLSIA